MWTDDSVACAPCQYWQLLGLGQAFKTGLGGVVREWVRGFPGKLDKHQVPTSVSTQKAPWRREGLSAGGWAVQVNPFSASHVTPDPSLGS